MRGSRTFRQGEMGWGGGTELTMFFFFSLSRIIAQEATYGVQLLFDGEGVRTSISKKIFWVGGGLDPPMLLMRCVQ